MEQNKYEEVAFCVRDYFREIAENNRMGWGEFLLLIFVCGWDISEQYYANDWDQCKETMRSILEIVLTSGENCYGTRAKD